MCVLFSYLHIYLFRSVDGSSRAQPGGAAVLRKYCICQVDRTIPGGRRRGAFAGGMNKHSRAAAKRMDEMVEASLAASQ